MRDEVDYTKFYYERQRPTEKEDIVPPTHPEINEVRSFKKRGGGKKGKKGRVLLYFVTILLCFGLVFFLADFFGKGFLSDAVTKAFSGETYEYYFVVEPASSRFTAYAAGLEVRQGGGGGYIMGEEEYCVAYSVYTDKTTALGVQSKNKVTKIETVSYKSKDNLAKMVDNLVRDMEKYIADWERGTVTEADVTTVLRVHKELFEGEKVRCEGEKRSLIDLTVEGLDGFSLSATEKITQLGQLRYFLCCVVYSAQSVF